MNLADAQIFKIAVEAIPIGLVLVQADGRIVHVNPKAAEIFGYAPSELKGELLEILLPERYRGGHEQLRTGFAQHPETRPMGVGRELWARRKDGSEFPVDVGLAVMDDLFLASVMDITKRRQAEAEILRRQAELETFLERRTEELRVEVAERTKLEERNRLGRELHDSTSQALYGIGLGIRTALVKVKKEQDPTDALEYVLGLTQSALVEMRALLFKLRPQSLENVPLAEVLKSHLMALGVRYELETRFESPQDDYKELPFDKKYAIYRIVTEALHNSVKHARAKRLEVSLTIEGGSVLVNVADDGTGFDPEQVQGGHGLASMKERARSIGGLLEFRGFEGTHLTLKVPSGKANE